MAILKMATSEVHSSLGKPDGSPQSALGLMPTLRSDFASIKAKIDEIRNTGTWDSAAQREFHAKFDAYYTTVEDYLNDLENLLMAMRVFVDRVVDWDNDFSNSFRNLQGG